MSHCHICVLTNSGFFCPGTSWEALQLLQLQVPTATYLYVYRYVQRFKHAGTLPDLLHLRGMVCTRGDGRDPASFT